MQNQHRFGVLCLLGVGLAACAPPAPPPASPPAAPSAAVAPPTAAPPPADAGAASAPAPSPVADAAPPAPEKKSEPEAAEEKPSRPPLDVLTGPETAFLINYSGSAPLENARKACTAKAGADDEAIAKCMTEAREAFKPDVLRFKKDGSHWSCIVYKRDGSRLDEVYSVRVDLSEASPNSVKLKFSGGDKGTRPLLKNKRDTVIKVPNDYSFIVDDADLGRLVYEAKVGLVGN